MKKQNDDIRKPWLEGFDVYSTVENHAGERMGVVPEQALRYNSGKLEYSMLDLSKFKEGVKVLMYGRTKYTKEINGVAVSGRDNWKKGLKTSEIIDSIMRHLSKIQAGEILDEESGLSHVGHLQANIMFLGNPNNEQDISVLPDDNVKNV